MKAVIKRQNWFGIDGIDCAGKTTCLEILKASLGRNLREVYFEQEFSSSCLGDFIKGIISEMRFFSLSTPPVSRLSDGLVILADFMWKLENALALEMRTVISDRCHLSVVGYQVRRAELLHGPKAATSLREAIEASYDCLIKNKENFMYRSILFTLSRSALVKRIEHRGETPLDDNQIDFLMSAQAMMVQSSPDFVIDTSHISPLDLAQKVEEIVLAIVGE